MTVHLVIAAAAVFSAFSYQPDGGAGLFPFASAASETAPLVNTGNPSCLPYQNGFFLSASAENPYSIQGLVSEECRAGYGDGSYGCAAAWSRFGIPEYLEDRFFLSAGKKCPGDLSAGIRGHADRLSIRTDVVSSSYQLYDADISLRWEPLPFFCLGWMQENTGSLFFERKRDLLFPATTLGVCITVAQGISLSWNCSRTAYGCVNALACSVYLLPQFMIGGGYSRETERYVFQSALLIRGMRVSYSFSYHPCLGATHHAGIAWSPSCDSYPSAGGSRPSYLLSDRADRTVDILSCSADELAEAAHISEEMASRLIRYRALYGKVTERSLYQMGLSAEERKAVMKHSFGIQSESEELEEERQEKIREKTRQKESFKQKKKDLFLVLVDGGIAPPSALKAALIVKNDRVRYAKAIEQSAEFTAQEKKRILELCAGQ